MAKKHDIIKEKLSDFMKSDASKIPHIGILVEGFKQKGDNISFMYEKNEITIPIKKVLFPAKKKVDQKEYVDYDSGTIWVFLKGTLLKNLTAAGTISNNDDCQLTCKVGITIPIIPTEEDFQLFAQTHHNFNHDFAL